MTMIVCVKVKVRSFSEPTTGIQSEPDAFENSMVLMTFLTSLGVA